MNTANALDDIVIDASQTTYITLTEAATSLGISRRAIVRDIKRGRIAARARPDGITRISLAELQRVYIDTPSDDLTPIAENSASNGARIADEEKNAVIYRERVEQLERDYAAANKVVTQQNDEISELKQQLYDQSISEEIVLEEPPVEVTEVIVDPDDEIILQAADQSTVTELHERGRRKSRDSRRTRRRMLAIAGVFGLAIAATGLVIGMIYVLDQSTSHFASQQK